MADQILSQEEIDALLHAMDSGAVDVKEEKRIVPKEARPYDLTSQSIMLRDQFDALDEVYDKFVSLMNGNLSTTLQRAFTIKIVSKEVVKFGEFLQAFSNPTGFCIFSVEPLIGLALLAVEPNLVFSIIDCMFGGSGKPLQKVREFTMIETRLLRRFILDVLSTLEQAWTVAFTAHFHMRKLETKPEFVNLVNPNDLLIVVVLSVGSGEFTGNLHVAIPYLMLEPVKDQLSSKYLREKDLGHSFGMQLRRLLRLTDVVLVAELGNTFCTVKDILEFDVDDVIKLNTGPQDPVMVKVENVPKFFGMPGIVKGNRAIQIVQLINENERE